MSAYSDLANIREAMNKGAYDLTKPLDFSILRQRRENNGACPNIRANLMSLRENSIMRMFVDESALTFMLRKYSEDDLTRTEHVDAVWSLSIYVTSPQSVNVSNRTGD